MHTGWKSRGGGGYLKKGSRLSGKIAYGGVPYFGFYCIFINKFFVICLGGLCWPSPPPPRASMFLFYPCVVVKSASVREKTFMCKIIRFVASLKNSFSNRMLHAVTSSVLSFSISLSTQLLHCRCVFIGPNIFKNELCIMKILCYGLYFLNVSNLLVDDQNIYFLN